MLRLLAEAMRHGSLSIEVMAGEDKVVKFVLNEERAQWSFFTESGLEITMDFFNIEVTAPGISSLKVLILR